MSAPKSCKEFDLGLALPRGLQPASLFPEDRLLRLHPHWLVREFKEKEGGFTARITDYISDERFDLTGEIRYYENRSDLIAITHDTGVPMAITFFKNGDRLKVRLDTQGADIEDDHPILLWVRAIREYLLLYTKTTPWTLFFRFIMNRMILQMNPSQRKISVMITKITVIEILVIILIVVGYVIFNQ